jgi:hypothetical protein
MCRAGGPRCKGNGRRTTSKTTTTSAAAAAPEQDRSTPTASAGTVPTREDADRLAAQLPTDRKGWDGKPLNDKDKRLYALRESGYKGPIDQDGYADTASEGAGTLRYMAEQRGETVDW